MSKEFWNLSGDIENIYSSTVNDSLFFETSLFLNVQHLISNIPANGIVAFCALLVSIFALITTINHNKNSVMPILNIYSEVNKLSDKSYRLILELENHGVGPAVNIDATLTINNKKVYGKNKQNQFIYITSDGDFLKLIYLSLREGFPDNNGDNINDVKRFREKLRSNKMSIQATIPYPETPIKAGGKLDILDVTFNNIDFYTLENIIKNISFEAEYKNVYGKKQKTISYSN